MNERGSRKILRSKDLKECLICHRTMVFLPFLSFTILIRNDSVTFDPTKPFCDDPSFPLSGTFALIFERF